MYIIIRKYMFARYYFDRRIYIFLATDLVKFSSFNLDVLFLSKNNESECAKL